MTMLSVILNCTLLDDNIRSYFTFYLHRRKNRGAERIWLEYWLLRTVIRIRVERRRRLVFKISNIKHMRANMRHTNNHNSGPEPPHGVGFGHVEIQIEYYKHESQYETHKYS
jgi:hypothetical protein